jgi:hypothetical protein
VTRRALGTLAILALVVGAGTPLPAQDTVVARPLFAVDTARLTPFYRAYEMFVQRNDSLHRLGDRTVAFSRGSYAGSPAWVLVETRSGAVVAAESLFLSPGARPLHWNATLGAARLAMEFARDSLFGATSGPAGKQNIVEAGRPDLVVSTAMMEALLPALALTPLWRDSAGVLTVDHVSSSILPAELVVIGEESLRMPGPQTDSLTQEAPTRRAWILALRAPARSVVFWVDRDTGAVLRMQQPLPLHVGSLLEYRLRSETPGAGGASAPPPPSR